MRRIFLSIFLIVGMSCSLTYAGVPKSRNLDASTSLSINPERSRRVEFDYEVEVKNIPKGASDVNIWIPFLPQTDYQVIEDITIEPQGATVTSDKIYHNKILYFFLRSPKDSSVKVKMLYKIKRFEYSKNSEKLLAKNSLRHNREDLTKYLKSNHLVTMSPKVKKIAATVTKGKRTALEKARAIYDYVFENVSYDKSIPGWGNGDTERVCLIKTGNCTDFHSLFISLARASGIPAKFVMGIPIAQDKTEGEIKGYHCWAEFYDRKLGWVPVDISEAWKDKTKREYYFGTIGDDRIELTQGRDIILEPPQKGEPLNYFFYPYVEINGKSYTNVEFSFKFKEQSKEGGTTAQRTLSYDSIQKINL